MERKCPGHRDLMIPDPDGRQVFVCPAKAGERLEMSDLDRRAYWSKADCDYTEPIPEDQWLRMMGAPEMELGV